MIEYCYYRSITDPFESRRQLPLKSFPSALSAPGGRIKMALCKCFCRPGQGNFKTGEYYSWLYAPGPAERTAHSLIQKISDSRSLRDGTGVMITFSPDDYSRFFRDVHRAATAISIYIDRKRELLFVTEFKQESSPFTIPSAYFCRLSSPYTEELIGQHFGRVWEEYKNHPEISTADARRLTPFYKTVTGGKGQRAFASGRWTLKAQFITSENEVYFTYLYKKTGDPLRT